MNNNIYGMPNTGFNTPTSYVDNYLESNIGRNMEVHVSFCDSIEWRDSVFKGILESVGKDYIVIANNNRKTIIWCVYIDYIIIE